jgi:hypothetical protein
MPFPLLPSTPSTASQINRLEATLQIVTQESAAKSSDISEQQLELTAALSAREQVEAQAASLTARVAELETAAACTESALSEQSQATEEVERKLFASEKDKEELRVRLSKTMASMETQLSSTLDDMDAKMHSCELARISAEGQAMSARNELKGFQDSVDKLQSDTVALVEDRDAQIASLNAALFAAQNEAARALEARDSAVAATADAKGRFATALAAAKQELQEATLTAATAAAASTTTTEGTLSAGATQDKLEAAEEQLRVLNQACDETELRLSNQMAAQETAWATRESLLEREIATLRGTADTQHRRAAALLQQVEDLQAMHVTAVADLETRLRAETEAAISAAKAAARAEVGQAADQELDNLRRLHAASREEQAEALAEQSAEALASLKCELENKSAVHVAALQERHAATVTRIEEGVAEMQQALKNHVHETISVHRARVGEQLQQALADQAAQSALEALRMERQFADNNSTTKAALQAQLQTQSKMHSTQLRQLSSQADEVMASVRRWAAEAQAEAVRQHRTLAQVHAGVVNDASAAALTPSTTPGPCAPHSLQLPDPGSMVRAAFHMGADPDQAFLLSPALDSSDAALCALEANEAVASRVAPGGADSGTVRSALQATALDSDCAHAALEQQWLAQAAVGEWREAQDVQRARLRETAASVQVRSMIWADGNRTPSTLSCSLSFALPLLFKRFL